MSWIPKGSRTQDLAFLALFALIVCPLVLSLVYGVQSLGSPFSLTLAPGGWIVVQGLLAALFVSAAVALLRSPHGLYIGLVSGLVLLNAPIFGSYLGWLGLAVPVAGIGVLTVSHLVGARLGRPRHLLVVALNLAVVLLLGFFMSLGAIAGSLFPNAHTQFLDQRAPRGPWVVTASEFNPGAMGGFDQTVAVHWDILGVLRLERGIYGSDQDRPTVRWVDGRTVAVNGRRVDIFRDNEISDYSW